MNSEMNDQLTEIFFEETQKFRQPWIWIIVLPISIIGIGIFIYILFEQLLHGNPVGNHPMPNTTLVWFGPLMILILLAIPVLLYSMHLHVIVTRDSINIHFFPFFKRKIPFSRISSFQARKYKPILDYGGWGIRWGPAGKAYNVFGSMGIQLIFKDGKKLLIGSQKTDEFHSALNSAIKKS
jgi:hypothetical protein